MRNVTWPFRVTTNVMRWAKARLERVVLGRTLAWAGGVAVGLLLAHPAMAAAELTERLQALCRRAEGSVAVAAIHVETGRRTAVQGSKLFPLYSVFKLPLAVAVLKDVEEQRLRLDRKVRVTPADVAPGSPGNTDLWRKPVQLTVRELLELSLVRSDNTSSDQLLRLVGGPAGVTRRMRALGLENLHIRSSVREFVSGGAPNTGSADDVARLLVSVQKGEALRPPQLAVLLGMMRRSKTGMQRLRGALPPGTPVADKTGTGKDGAATHDVGLITLPEGGGRLAIAVLISGSKLRPGVQEKLIADIGRAAYDAHVSRAAPRKPGAQ